MRFPSTTVRRVVFFGLSFLAVTAALGQSTSVAEATVSRAPLFETPLFQESYTRFAATAATADPADSVCQRLAAGSVVTSPPQLTSSGGKLELYFYFKTVVDEQGLTRYCYISDTGYEAPTLQVNPGDQLIIHFVNDIPASSAAKSTMPGMVMKANASSGTTTSACDATAVASTSTNLHFHGLNVAPTCGQDEVIHTLIQPEQTFDYTVQIPSNEPAGMYWYHPHPHGYSQPQVLGGATGIIIVGGIQNFNPSVAGLPERILVIRDQPLTAAELNIAGAQPGNDLSLNYVPVTYPNYVPGVIETPVATKEFWRVANTSANSLINLQVIDNNVAQTMQVVGVDGVPITDGSGNPTTNPQTSWVLGPGARVEFIVVTPKAGDTAQLVTQAWNNGPDGDADPARPLANIVASTSNSDGQLPVASLAPVAKIPAVTQSLPAQRFKALNTTTAAAAAATVQRSLYFSVKSDFSQFYITVAGQTPAVFNMDGSPNIVTRSGTVEQWTISNQSLLDHAFHIHQIHFRTLAINGVAVTDYTERDTINIPHWSGSGAYPSVTLLMDFTDPDIVGTFVYHCHVLSHEDRGMMGSIQVLPPLVDSTTSLSASGTRVNPGTSVTLKATVTSASGTPTGTIAFSAGSTSLGSATLNSSGIASLTTTALPTGVNSVTAAYSGDSNYAASTSSPVTINVTTAATITGLSRTYGANGVAVTVSGRNFGATQGSSTLTFNGVPATSSQYLTMTWSNTSITAPVPASATSGDVVVTAAGQASNGLGFTVEPSPVITGISPSSGPVGALVTITGTNLMDAGGQTAVTFGSIFASLVSVSSTSIQVHVPSGATTGNIRVHANGTGYNSPIFTVTSAPLITSLSRRYGASGVGVTVTGTGFGATQGSSTLTFNGVPATSSQYLTMTWSNTSITAPVPASATSGDVVVTAAGQASNGLGFTVEPSPVITGISPSSGPVGALVTITGTNLMDAGGQTAVTFGSIFASLVSVSSTSIQVDVPSGATTGPIRVHANGTGYNSPIFTVN